MTNTELPTVVIDGPDQSDESTAADSAALTADVKKKLQEKLEMEQRSVAVQQRVMAMQGRQRGRGDSKRRGNSNDPLAKLEPPQRSFTSPDVRSVSPSWRLPRGRENPASFLSNGTGSSGKFYQRRHSSTQEIGGLLQVPTPSWANQERVSSEPDVRVTSSGDGGGAYFGGGVSQSAGNSGASSMDTLVIDHWTNDLADGIKDGQFDSQKSASEMTYGQFDNRKSASESHLATGFIPEEQKADSFFSNLRESNGYVLGQDKNSDGNDAFDEEKMPYYQDKRQMCASEDNLSCMPNAFSNVRDQQQNLSDQYPGVESSKEAAAQPQRQVWDLKVNSPATPHPWDHISGSQSDFWWHLPGPLRPNTHSWPNHLSSLHFNGESSPGDQFGINAFKSVYEMQETPEPPPNVKFNVSLEDVSDTQSEHDASLLSESEKGSANNTSTIESEEYKQRKREFDRLAEAVSAIENFKDRIIIDMETAKKKSAGEADKNNNDENENVSKLVLQSNLDELIKKLNITDQTPLDMTQGLLKEFKEHVEQSRKTLVKKKPKQFLSPTVREKMKLLKETCNNLQSFREVQDTILQKAESTLKTVNGDLLNIPKLGMSGLEKLETSKFHMHTMMKEFIVNRFKEGRIESLPQAWVKMYAEEWEATKLQSESSSSDSCFTDELDPTMKYSHSKRMSSLGVDPFPRVASCPQIQGASYQRLCLAPSLGKVNTNVQMPSHRDRLRSVDKDELAKKATKCSLCKKTYKFPHALHCSHVFCFSCVARLVKKAKNKNGMHRVKCPNCSTCTVLKQADPNSLLADLPKCLYMCRVKISPFNCTSCSNDEAMAYCKTCYNYLCQQCVDAHGTSKSLASHSVTDKLKICCYEGEIFNMCTKHNDEMLRQYCDTCHVPLCIECAGDVTHKGHTIYKDNEWDCVGFTDKIKARITAQGKTLKAATDDLRGIMQKNKILKQNIENSHRLILRKIDDFCNAVEEMRAEAVFYVDRMLNEVQDSAYDLLAGLEAELTSKEEQLIAFMEFFKRSASAGEMSYIMISAPKLQTCYEALMQSSQEVLEFRDAIFDINFTPSYPEVNDFFQDVFNGIIVQSSINVDFMKNPLLKERLEDDPTEAPSFGASVQASLDSRRSMEPPSSEAYSDPMDQSNAILFDYPRVTFTYKEIFGKFGRGPHEFAEPSGVEYLMDGGLAVCDTKNHRIMIYGPDFSYLRTIGQPLNLPPLEDASDADRYGEANFERTPGTLHFPYRLAQCPRTSNIVVVERQPSLCIQIFTLSGTFVRSFGHDTLRSPRGVTVDEHGVIIIVEGRTMKVVRFSDTGKKLFYAHASLYLEFPNDIAARNGLIYISDNRAHCVHVFDYAMEKVSTIGNESVTYYPIGVTLNTLGQVVVTDNHNTFNVSIFAPDGTYLYGFRSRAKYANCFNVTVTRAGLELAVTTRDCQVLCFNYERRPEQQIDEDD